MSYRRLCKAIAAAAVAIGLTAGTVTANANDITLFGGGGGNAGGGMPTGSGQMYMTWRYQDNNDGGFGPATDTNSVRKALELDWTTITGNADQWISEATAEANTNCVNRFNEAHPGETASCRVVAVGAVGETNRRFGYPAGAAHYIWMDAWNQIVAQNGPYRNNGKEYHTNDIFADQPGTSVDSLADQWAPDYVNGQSTGSIVVIALNQYEPVNPSYTLNITTSQQAGSIQVGATDAVHDVIHASGGDGEQVAANVILHYKGNKYVQAASKSKSVNITTNGDTNSPDFTPADFGWEHWQAGTYWFDVQAARQGNMSDAVDTADEEASETYRVTAVPPEAPGKEIEEGVSADAMTNRTTITTGTGAGGYEMTIKDVIDPNGVAYTVDNYKLIDKTDDNKDISGQFTIGWDQASNTVTAVRSADQGEMPIDHEYEFSFDVTVSLPDDWQNVEDEGFVQWNEEPEASTGSKEFPTWKPNPDKSWIKMGADGTWQAVIDPDETNTTGADTQTFLDGDKVASVVNGTVAADLIEAPETLSLEDDWTAADYLFDADAENIRVYAAEAASDRESSVSDIVNTGKDVTKHFDITVDKSGLKAVASAKKDYLKTLKGLDKPLQLTLLIPGAANFANGKGAEQVRADFGKQPGEELTFCADPAASQNPTDATLTNAGAQTVNGQREETNEPYICGYLPPVVKDVLAEGSEGGDQESVDGEIVFPGQKVEYQLLTTPQLPADMAYSVTEVAVTDTYSEYLEIDRQTLEITDLNTGKTIGKSKYATTWDDENHTLRIVFDADYVHDNWQPGSNPRILIRFEGTVSKDAPADTKVDNQWGLTLNNSLTPSNKVENLPPDITPGKEDTQKDPSIDIDGKTALLGDTIYYRIHVDASKLTDTAYKVWRLGMVDDYDEEYLRLDRRGIQITDETGRDVTSRFNIADRDGVAYAFAKTVDTYVDTTGETIPGDPQPDDLKAYSELKDEDHDPLTDPAIDQTLLGHTYTVVLPMTVIKVTDGYVVSNTATQVTNGERDVTNTVTNPVKPVNPSKDVVVSVGGDSVNGGSIYKDHMFLYQLDSSILPADRAYPIVTDWTGTDQLDTERDRYTGQWAVYATRDLYKDGTVIAQAGERIAGSDFDGSKFGGDLFTVTAGDTGLITVAATQTYLDLVSADNGHEAGWRLYLQVERTAVADRVENTWTETINGQPRESNVVWTKTPDMTPSLKIEKWDEQSGFPAGDRDDSDDALKMTGDSTRIVFTITNTSKVDPDTGDGAWFAASDLDLSDSLIVGSGTIDMDSLEYPDNWDTLVLKPGESVDVKGTLSGVQAGDVHTDRAIVTGVPLVACPTDTDDPFAEGSDPDDAAGADTGDGQLPDGAVEIDGTVLCEDTIVTSNTDDWNGYRAKPLASTGSAVAVAALIGLGLLMTGATLVYTVRRRTGGDARIPAGSR